LRGKKVSIPCFWRGRQARRLTGSIILGIGFTSLNERKDAGQVKKPDALDASRFTDRHGADETLCRPFIELRA